MHTACLISFSNVRKNFHGIAYRTASSYNQRSKEFRKRNRNLEPRKMQSRGPSIAAWNQQSAINNCITDPLRSRPRESRNLNILERRRRGGDSSKSDTRNFGARTASRLSRSRQRFVISNHATNRIYTYIYI